MKLDGYENNYTLTLQPNKKCEFEQSVWPVHHFTIKDQEMLGFVIRYNNSNQAWIEQFTDNVKKSSNGYPLVRYVRN